MISEIDINDWERTEKVDKLYNVPSYSIVSLATDYSKMIPFVFFNVDGMYSNCKEINLVDNFHPAAWTEVYLWKKKGTTSQ